MNCLSCGQTNAPESGEHVFSKWLLKYLDALRAPISHFRYQVTARNESHVTSHLKQVRLNSFQLRSICQPCNSGWMSRLENDAKPIVIGLMERTLKPGKLDSEQRRVLARRLEKQRLSRVMQLAQKSQSVLDSSTLCANTRKGHREVLVCLLSR